MVNIKACKDGVILSVKVKPRSERFSVVFRDQIFICCKSPAAENKANIEIIKEFQTVFGKEAEILSGLKSKNKNILIHNITEEEAKRLILWK